MKIKNLKELTKVIEKVDVKGCDISLNYVMFENCSKIVIIGELIRFCNELDEEIVCTTLNSIDTLFIDKYDNGKINIIEYIRIK